MSLLDYWETRRGAVKRRKSDKSGSYHYGWPETPGDGRTRDQIVNFLECPDSELLGLSGLPALAGPDSGAVAPEYEFTGVHLTEVSSPNQRSELEISLPPVKTNPDAIEAYETSRWLEQADDLPDLQERVQNGKWQKSKSSIYVDAFNLALETVLDEESHLFDEAEMELFRQWRSMSYESQYLYVRLFLRKTSGWHRINRLGYYSDVADIPSVVVELRRSRDLPVVPTLADDRPCHADSLAEATFGDSFRFAEGIDEITSLEEASSLLLLDELKSIAKEAKVQGKSKQELRPALRRSSQTQSALGWSTKQAGKQNQTENRDRHYISKILDLTGDCIRLAAGPRALFERVHLVFYKSTEWTEKSLTAIILGKISRKTFPEYIVCRSSSIFPSRQILREFESALRIQFQIDAMLEFNGTPTAKELQQIEELADQVYPRWKALLKEEQQKQNNMYKSCEGAYLRLFSPAWVYTRVVHKGLHPLGRSKKHKREHELLTELLDQRLFHAARRGAWYQRKALIEEHYMWLLTPYESRGEEAQKKHWKRIALRTCEQGLEDPECHLIYHYDLQKRITKLERALRVVKREQHDFGHVLLARPVERNIEGVQVEREGSPSGSCAKSHRDGTSKRGRPTVWIDEWEGGPEYRVESMCLSWYRNNGWKGYHTEGGIVKTLFGYLFYDIIFMFVPNVFQTPFQTCPLDLHTDAFYPSRASEISHRLVEITNGRAEDIIRAVHAREAAKQTCAVGIDWSFELGDLIEIVQCFRGEALAAVCKVLAQEYKQRGGGIPDLFLWNLETKEVMFAEVKSKNDRLSDTQRLWIHVLMGAGIRVELCNAVAKEVRLIPDYA